MNRDVIERSVLDYYPNTQAIYLFGSWGTPDEWPNSDVDIALLLRADESKAAGFLGMSTLRFELESRLKRDVDLINLRQVSTVFQNEIIHSGRVLMAPEAEAMRAFEMQTLSAYQKLNEERREILAEFFRTKRAYSL